MTIHAALEIGTSRTVLALGEAETGGRVRVSCLASIPSAGIRKSQIFDIAKATQSVRGVLQEIERLQSEQGGTITVGNAFLAVSGQHIRVEPFTGTAQISGSHVSDDDLRVVADNSRMMQLAKDRELLDIIDQDYAIDALGGITSPRGMSGRILHQNTLHIHADRNRIEDARTASNTAHLEIREALFAATCAADATLEDYERKNGSLVLDLGGGSTGYAAYCDGHLAAAGVIGVGGDHITNDISHAFQTTIAQAEELKRNSASASVRPDDDTARIRIPGSSPLMESRTVSRHALDTVVNARVRELVAMLRERLEEHDLAQRLHAGVILTGGGAELADIDALIQRELGTCVRLGRPIHVDMPSGLERQHTACAIAGALLFAHRNYEEKSILDGLFGRFFR